MSAMSAMSATAACRGLASSAPGLSSARVIASDVAAIQQANRGVGGATIHFISRSSSAIASSASAAMTSRLSSSYSSLSFFRARCEQAEEEGNLLRQSGLALNSAVPRRCSFSLFPRGRAACVASVAPVAAGTSDSHRERSLPSVVVPKALAQGEAGEEEVEGGPQAENLQGRVITGKCFVVDDNIDTDQIIPAERLTLVPSKADEYEKLGSYAMEGLPARYGAFIEEGEMKTKYAIMIGGKNFGCGSSREHAPVALGAAGCKAVVAQSFARIFFRNCVATGELYPVETDDRVCDECATGNEVTVDMVNDVLVNHTTGKQYRLTPIGEAGPVIDAGGIFSYARQTGMIAQPTPA